MSRILYVVQHKDAMFRCAQLCKAFGSLCVPIEVLLLNFGHFDDQSGALPVVKETLFEYLQKYGQSLHFVILDSPETLLFSARFFELLSPNAKVFCNLRVGPYLEFISQSKELKEKSLQVLRRVSAIILSGAVERECGDALKLPANLMIEINTPIDTLRCEKLPCSGEISLVGDFSHPQTFKRLKKMLEHLKATPDHYCEFNCCAEGDNVALSGLSAHDSSKHPSVRLFISDTKNYDNAAILSSLAAGIVVIASDPAVFSLGLNAKSEYVPANHPRTFIEALSLILNDSNYKEKIASNAKTFIKQEHAFEKTTQQLHKLLEVHKFA